MKNSTSKVLKSLTAFAFVIFIFYACTKINSSTSLGVGIIPGADGVTTFEKNLIAEADNFLFKDSSLVGYNDDLTIGNFNDPTFGSTNAEAFLNFSYTNYGIYPFLNKDSVIIDSVVLSLAYTKVYGDSTTIKGFTVYEIAKESTFSDTIRYTYNNLLPILTNQTTLGSILFTPSKLKDSIQLIHGTDTTKETNTIRIKLNNALGQRFLNYDTTTTANGAYRTDSILKTLFKGLAIKSISNANGLVYISPVKDNKTNLKVYYHTTVSGATKYATVAFYHSFINGLGMANNITRTPAGEFNQYLNNASTNEDKAFVLSTPGSYVKIKIPGLDTFKNVVVHYAELIAPVSESLSMNVFKAPPVLYLDRISTTGDSAFIFENDMSLQYQSPNIASYAPSQFGGILQGSLYRFNITRYVQAIITHKNANHTLRLYAPTVALFYSKSYSTLAGMRILDYVADGRVVVKGGDAAAVTNGMRLRIVYSTL